MNYQYRNRHSRDSGNFDRKTRAMGSVHITSNRERPPPLVKFDELLQWEPDHGSARHQDRNEYDDPFPVASNRERPPRLDFDELSQKERDHGFAKYQDHNGYDGHGRTGRAMNFVLGDSYRRGLPLRPTDLEDCQWERNHRSWR